jgi:hypothetical protein
LVLLASHQEAATRLAACCRSGIPAGVAMVSGADRHTRRGVTAAALANLGMSLYALNAEQIPAAPEDREQLARLWEREALLSRASLLIEVDDHADADVERRAGALLDGLSWGAIAAGDEPVRVNRPVPQVDVPRPGAADQYCLWQAALGPAVAGLNGSLQKLVSQFDLGPHEIQTAAAQIDHRDSGLRDRLWDACRAQARPRLDDLAQRIEPKAGWDDLVLGADQLDSLREIAIHVRGRGLVQGQWGFAERSSRGLGISALFEGPSGTGKTMAAEVLAGELNLDLYRIDLSQVVSKYIGETEKNLRRVFDAAESGGVILLFDEADALFGKRSEVKDSHDRYANIEIGYLLTRMEAYRGLAILTTNAREAIDTAFMRRIRFVIRFAYPGTAERAAIWRRAFPSRTPIGDLDSEALAQVALTGANIANVALGAAFLAADAGESVTMRHIARAAVRERAKIDSPLSPKEISGWM